ncbi:transmembrane protein 45B-like [Copidosoma floridanum]|uniref:transmembrane protein 45B-like n=1 Tax=Copidosoma floridanum TaxID=29053 RepID=UPI0006C940C2|nr:transmembrane protein 45B-like [Copidosoma floridanum]
MVGEENNLPYLLTGCIFYAFGIKWCCEYARMWYVRPKPRQPRESPKLSATRRLKKTCSRVLNSHPIEGCLKLIATVFGLCGTLSGGLPNSGIVAPKVVHSTIYTFFAFSGLVDVLHFYFPRNVSDGLVKLALGQSFFVEGFLFVWASVSESPEVNLILAATVWLTCVAVALELVWPEMKLLRGASTLLHGAWLAHMVRVFRSEPLTLEKIALTYSWHVAAASTVTLLAVVITRSCIPRVPPQPPEVPIYDYCNELEIRSS